MLSDSQHVTGRVQFPSDVFIKKQQWNGAFKMAISTDKCSSVTMYLLQFCSEIRA